MAIYKSKTPTKDGRQYFFRIKYKDIFGTYHDHKSILFKNKKDAENEEAAFRIKINNQEAYVSTIRFKYVFDNYILNKSKLVKKQTLYKIKVQLMHFEMFNNLKVNDISINHYNELLKYLENQNLAISYINKLLGLFKSIILFSNKYYNTSIAIIKFIEPLKNNKLKKEMDFYTLDEYKQFDKTISDIEWHTFFEMLYYLGLRQGECQSLTWNDINMVDNTVSITKTLTTKIKGEKYTISNPKTKNSIRTLPIPNKIIDDLKILKTNAQKYTDYNNNWFVFGNTLPFAETTICNKKNEYCKLANLRQIRIHDFRHSCASLLINKGASITLVSKYLGHSSISITLNTYTHLYKNELKDISTIINNI